MIGDIPMRRFESQVWDREIIRAILDQIQIVHVGINDGDYPYVVPMNFGYEMAEDRLLVYLHCAKEGHKVDLWTANPKVSLTFSMFTNHPNDLYRGAMHDFRSVMANGIIRRLVPHESGAQHGRAVQAILSHNGRRPNQFSVPHYMFMDVYVVECDWAHVTAKSEEPMDRAEEAAFPSLEEIRANTEPPRDYAYYFSRKQYRETAPEGFATGLEACPPLEGAWPVPDAGSLVELEFRWSAAGELKLDCDIAAYILDGDGQIPRRYDMAFCNQARDRSGAICHLGDDIVGIRGKETVTVNLEKLPDFAGRILFVISVYEADRRGWDLGMIDSLGIKMKNGGTESAFRLEIPETWRGKTAAAAGELVPRGDGVWELKGPAGKTFDDWKAAAVFGEYGLKRWKE